MNKFVPFKQSKLVFTDISSNRKLIIPTKSLDPSIYLVLAKRLRFLQTKLSQTPIKRYICIYLNKSWKIYKINQLLTNKITTTIAFFKMFQTMRTRTTVKGIIFRRHRYN